VPVFNKALEDDDDLKLQAAEALAKIGAALEHRKQTPPEAPLRKIIREKTVPLLAKLLEDGPDNLRAGAAAALGAMGRLSNCTTPPSH
jgi:HEAT repeat protein